MTTFSTTLLQDSFKSATFSVESSAQVSCTKYDIRVVRIPLGQIGEDAVATATKLQGFNVSSTPTLFQIPVSDSMQSGTTYKATLRLYSSSNTVIHTAVGVFYYDTRTFSVDHLLVDSNPNPNYPASQVFPNFSHSTPVVNADDVALDPSSDSFFSYVKLDKVSMSCTNISQVSDEFDANTEYYLGEQSYAVEHTYNWLVDASHNDLPSDRAYELWGLVSFALADLFSSSFITPTFTFGLEIKSVDTTVGYYLENPNITLALGDVLGTVSENPIVIRIVNFDNYAVYPFDSITVNVRATDDLTEAALFTGNKLLVDFSTGDNHNQVAFTSADLQAYANETPLIDGQKYYFEFLLNFTDADLYKPTQYRSVVKHQQFNDELDPIIDNANGDFVNSVVNSWQLDNGAGLVVSFKKTLQFLGNKDAPYNLDKYGNTTVKAEYSVTCDSSGNWSVWHELSGGSIAQGSVTFSTNSNNTNGIYAVPKHISSATNGPAQDYVNIYAVIPNRANYNLVKVRLTLSTDNESFASDKQTSATYYVRMQEGYTYNVERTEHLKPKIDALTIELDLVTIVSAGLTLQIEDPLTPAGDLPGLITQFNEAEAAIALLLTQLLSAMPSFRYFPKHEAQDFDVDVPFITDIAEDVVAFSVPVSVNPYFKAMVTSSETSGDYGSADPYLYDAEYVDTDEHDVTGLTYPISYTGATFNVSVQYVYLENTAIVTNSVSKTIQQQGLLPVTTANVVNSWQLNPAHGDGLVVSFKKTVQFMGNSSASYNLDASGNQATVMAEYRVKDASGNWSVWHKLSGGSIAQGSVTFSTNAANTNGVYAVPQHRSSAAAGSAQADVTIYAEIPDRDLYQLVQVRVTLLTESTEYDPLITQLNPQEAPIQLSDIKVVEPVATATYPDAVNVPSFRHFPAPAKHDFAVDVPFITDIVTDVVAFSVPVSVPPFFSSNVTTDGNTSGIASIVSNADGNSANYLNDNVTNLSYVPTADSTFQLTVSYTCNENTAIYTDDESMTVQMQGVPVNEFSIVSAAWNSADQQLNYTLTISATSTSAYRMDGWDLYTKLSTESDAGYVAYANVLRSAGLTQSISLDSSYPEVALIYVKFVATRSLYLSSTNYDNQVETVSGLDGAVDAETTQITKLQATLPVPTASDIVLSDIIYNMQGLENQNATLSVTLAANVSAVRITESDDTQHISTSSTYDFSGIALTSTPTPLSYTVEFKYDSVDNASTPGYYYSAPVTVSFNTGKSNRAVPVIDSKNWVSSTDFEVIYTSVNSGSYNAATTLTSTVYVLTGVNDPHDVGPDDGSVNLMAYKGLNVDMYVNDSYESSYSVGSNGSPTTTQSINSSSVNLYVAFNPKIIESSIAVDRVANILTFSMDNNGAPFIDQILVVFAQDATIAEGDQGVFALSMFQQTGGFAIGPAYGNTLTGGPLHSMIVTEISGSGIDMVTSFAITFTIVLSAQPPNIVIYGANAVEGADSYAVGNFVNP